MFTSKQYRAKAEEYRQRGEDSAISNEVREFKALERTFAELAHNEEWLAKNFDKIVLPGSATDHADYDSSSEAEGHILQCLGAAVIMEWNSIPTAVRRELFDSASSMGELLRTGELRGQIARFLHTHRQR